MAGNQKKAEDPKIPCAPDAERCLLGAMLVEQENALKAFSIMKGEEFFTDTNRVVFRAMQELAGKSLPIGIVEVVDELNRSKMLTRAGGAAYISSLVDGMPRVVNVENYAKMIGDSYKLRRLLHFTEEVRELVDGKGEVEEVVEAAVQKLLEISSTGSGGPLVRTWGKVAESAITQIQHDHDYPEKSARVYTGIKDLDDSINGFRKKEVVVIVGPTSHGKTLLAQQITDYAEKQGYPGIFFSGEMPGEQVVLRQLAYDAKLDFWKIRFPEKMHDEEIDTLREESKKERNVVMVENDITPMNIWALCETHKRTRDIVFAVVDYDQIIIEAGIDSEDEEDFFRHQRRFMFQSKKTADRLDICLIILSQLRKVSHNVAKGGKPTIDDIYGDSSIRNVPHTILWVVRHFFLHDLKPEFERKATVYIIKARNGRTCKVDLTFDQNRVRLISEEPSEKNSTKDSPAPKSAAFAIDDAPF